MYISVKVYKPNTYTQDITIKLPLGFVIYISPEQFYLTKS